MSSGRARVVDVAISFLLCMETHTSFWRGLFAAFFVCLYSIMTLNPFGTYKFRVLPLKLAYVYHHPQLGLTKPITVS